MFTNIYIDNFLGISAPIELNFISKSRKKEENSSIAKIEDGIYVNKIIGIIGGNASGKTSIITAINAVGSILTSSIRQFNAEDKFNYIQNIIEKDPSSENRKLMYDFLHDFNSSIDIAFQNLRRKDENTIFKVEMYIESKKEELNGYYNYNVELNGIKKRIEKEFLGFRKKYEDKIEPIVEITDSKEGQVYYINRFFKNITDIDNTKKEELEKKYQYTKTFAKHYIENSANISTETDYDINKQKFKDWYKKSPNTFRSLVRVVDSKIKDVMIDTDNKYEELLFILKDGSKITRNMLSTGTERFLNTMSNVSEIIEKNGILIIDEIEQNLHKELVELIIKLFGEMSKNRSQLIFTTLSPEIFDITNKDNKKIFKQDAIFIINSDYDDIKVERLMDLKIDGKRVKGDASVANLYKERKISVHPNKEQIKIFLENFNDCIK